MLGSDQLREGDANCGPIGDGCGGVLDCGQCVNGSCGGGGKPSVCGTPPCSPKNCGSLGFDCGPAGDGCGGQLACGTCTGADTCGGGSQSGVCGHGATCVKKTCQSLAFDCGPAGDGCGGLLDCGTCIAPKTCGGGGTPSQCGAPVCTPKSCASVGAAACGPIADGCGNLLQCGTCAAPATCGAAAPSTCGVPNTCTNLCLNQVACSGGKTTTISGIVYAPNGTDPLPNALVYVPNAPVAAFAAGVACDNCGASVSGSPLVSASTGPDGKFTLTNAPVGNNIPLVVQIGRWRRQVTLPTVTSCVDNPQPATLTRFPKNRNEGDIPHMALATGSLDSLECVLRKIGVEDGEFTAASGPGRVHLYTGAGSAGASAGTGTTSESNLWSSSSTLNQYDMVLFPCQGGQYDMTPSAKANMVAYANAGGRIFATHYSYVWLFDNAPFNGTALWSVDGPAPSDQTGTIDTSFPKGATLAQWLVNVGATPTYGQIPIKSIRKDMNGVVAPAQSWISISTPAAVMHYTFNTPIGASSSQQCGRVLYDDFHVEEGLGGGTTFPAECTAGAMTPQEKLLEFMLFDLGSCVTTDVPQCTPTTCAAQAIQCGPAGNGCGAELDCGPCPANQTCGGGGVPSVCGAPSCAARTCLAQSIQCGPAGDGCGKLLDCGACTLPDTCGGGGTPGVCGSGTCTPRTCAVQGIKCGPAGDGCGNALQCGTCPTGQTCGGGGTPGICGTRCSPRTCAGLGINCGAAGDGCGAQLNCGTCVLPQTCGGGGKANICGGSTPN